MGDTKTSVDDAKQCPDYLEFRTRMIHPGYCVPWSIYLARSDRLVTIQIEGCMNYQPKESCWRGIAGPRGICPREEYDKKLAIKPPPSIGGEGVGGNKIWFEDPIPTKFRPIMNVWTSVVTNTGSFRTGETLVSPTGYIAIWPQARTSGGGSEFDLGSGHFREILVSYIAAEKGTDRVITDKDTKIAKLEVELKELREQCAAIEKSLREIASQLEPGAL